MTGWFCSLPPLYQGIAAVGIAMLLFTVGLRIGERRRLDSEDGRSDSASDRGEDDVQA